MKAVHVVVPDGIDDPGRPSGGNVYDRRLIDGLASAGWVVDVHPVAGSWPEAGPAARERLRLVLAGMAEGSVVLVDGLIASAVPDVLVPESRRLRVVVLVHLPLGGRDDPEATTLEGRVLSAAAAVVTTSRWTRDRVLELYALPPQRVHVASPGAARSAAVRGTPQGRQLLCVAALTRDKGHDVLLAALGKVSDLEWNLVCVGSRDVDQAYAAELAVLAEELGIGGRVWFAGTQSGPATGHVVRRRRRGRAADQDRELRDGADRGARPRHPGDRLGGRWCARGSRHVLRGRGRTVAFRACWCHPATPAPSPTPSDAGSRSPSCASPCARTRWSDGRR